MCVCGFITLQYSFDPMGGCRHFNKVKFVLNGKQKLLYCHIYTKTTLVCVTDFLGGGKRSEKARGKMSALCDIYKGAPWLDMKVKGEEVSEVFSLLQFTPKI